MHALAYLHLCMLKNGILTVLRDPKRLAPALLFAGWVGLTLLVGLAGWTSGVRPGAYPLPFPVQHMQLLVVAALVLLSVAAVERGLQGKVLSFAAPDYDFLFPTPVSRRLVVAWRVLADGVGLAMWAAVLVVSAVMFFRVPFISSLSPVEALLLAVAGWMYAVFVVNLARIIELALAGMESGFTAAVGLTRKILWAVTVLVLVVVGYAVLRGGPETMAAGELLYRPPLSILLLPMLVVASFATGEASPLWGSTEAGVLLLFVLATAAATAVCLLNRDVIEATIGHSRRVAQLREAARNQDVEQIAGQRLREEPGIHRSLLVAWSSPDLAGAYKALAEALHSGGLRWVGYALLVVAPAVAGRLLPVNAQMLAILHGPVVAYLLLLIAGFYALRFRSELSHIALLRALPSPPWRLLLGLVIPRAVAYSAALAAGVAALWISRPEAGWDLHLAVAMCILPATATTLLVSAAVTCIFPRTTDPSHRMLGGLLMMSGVSVGLAPCAVVLIMGALLGASGLPLGLVGFTAQLPAMAGAAAAAGYLFGRFEPVDT